MIDQLRERDAVAAAALSATFGWPHRHEDWALFLRLGQGIAWREDGRLAGTAMWFPLAPDYASIGLVQVAADLQGRGIGRRLMRSVMERAAARNLTLHATREGAGLYASLGFSARGLVQQWQGICPHASREPSVPAKREDILRLDEAATGLLRGHVLSALLDDATATIADDAGYAIRRVFGRGSVIGPVIAKDAAIAASLVRAVVGAGFMRIDVPAGKNHILDGLGLDCVDEGLAMSIGEWPAADETFALAAQALG